MGMEGGKGWQDRMRDALTKGRKGGKKANKEVGGEGREGIGEE